MGGSPYCNWFIKEIETNGLVELQQEREGDSPAIIQNRILCNQIFQKFPEEVTILNKLWN